MTRQDGFRAAFVVAATMLLIGGAVAGGPPSDSDQRVRGPLHVPPTPQISEGVVGRLVQPSERPIAGAMISATSLDRPTKPVPEIAILTDAEGAFVWPLQPGAYRLSAVVDGRPIATAVVSVRPGEVTRVDLQAAPQE